MANNALAFVAGLGTGYLSSKEREKDRARQEKKDAQDQELHDARMHEINKTKKRDEALAKAYQETTVNEGAVTLDISGKPVVYESADVAGSDYRQARALQDRAPMDTPAAQASVAPVVPTGQIQANGAAVPAPALIPPVAAAPTPIAPPKATFAAGGIAYGDKASAQSAATAANAPDAQNKRAAQALRAMGDPAAAAALEATGRQAKLADIQLSQAEKQQVHEAAFREVTEAFARQGWNALPKIYENYNDGKTAKVAEDGKGGAIVTTYNDKGEQVGQKAFKDEMDFITGAVAKLDPKIWVTMKAQQVKDDRAQGNWEATHALAVDGKNEARRHNLATEGLAGQRLAGAGGGGGGGGSGGGRGGKAGTGAASETVGFNPMGNFDAKKAQDVAFEQARKAAEVRQEAGKPMTPAEQGRVAQEIYRSMEDSFSRENTRRHVAGVVSSELRAASADPAKYAESYAKAQKLGLDDKTLTGLGFKPPAGAAPAAGPGTKAVTVPNPLDQGQSAPAPAAKAAPAPAPAPKAATVADKRTLDPVAMGAKLKAENLEMANGQRMSYSAEVKAFQEQIRAEKAIADQAASKAFREKELQRSLAATRGLQ
jgi:hypothetical protein